MTSLQFKIVSLMLLQFLGWTFAEGQTIPFESDRWEIQARQSSIVEFAGRKCLSLQGGYAWIKDEEFVDGIIEFDIAFSGERGFVGGFWRMQDMGNYEEFYMRPHQSGNPDATQYTPIFNSLAGWQLYHGEGYGAQVTFKFNQWMHIKIVVSGDRGEVYIDSEEPVLTIHEMKREIKAGKWGVVAKSYAPAYFSNFNLQNIQKPELKGKPKEKPTLPAGMVSQWSVSTSFNEKQLLNKIKLTDADKRDLKWTVLPSENSGTVNLARIQGITQERQTAFAKLAVSSDSSQTKNFAFGFSDRVKVFLNGRLIYSGNNAFRSRDYRYLGTIGLFDELCLPLKKGRNEIWLAVSESFGGWGVKARFEDLEGIQFVE